MSRITSKDKWELVKEGFLCFHCREKLIEKSTIYEISQKKSIEGYQEPITFKSNNQYKRILFHPQCFEEVAGEDYCFSEEE